ncbi:MAG: helix-turn-helix domain-containing protein [Candidatus Magasanikbacteria bacterium]|nr:helix-turn-helix domain-containing protein [Candidatus Magasanikbacteria bacterium]
MTIFCYKKLEATRRLGQRLKEAREEAKLTLEYIGQITHIATPYLEAIENGEFKKLPKAVAFRRAYIKEFAQAVGLNEKECLEQLAREAGLLDAEQVHPHRQIVFSRFASVTTALRTSLLLGAVVLFAGYLLWQIHGVLQPPRLTLISPQEGELVNSLTLAIQGQTEPEVTLKVNGQDVMVNEAGRFNMKVDVSEGVSTLTFEAIKKHGKKTTITRHVVVRAPKYGEKVSLGASEPNY